MTGGSDRSLLVMVTDTDTPVILLVDKKKGTGRGQGEKEVRLWEASGGPQTSLMLTHPCSKFGPVSRRASSDFTLILCGPTCCQLCQ